MKRTLLITLALLLSLTIQAQNDINIISEDFSGETIPSGWQATGNGVNNWYLSYSFSAGGKPNELQLSWTPPFNGTARFVSPAVDLTGITSAMMTLNHYVVIFSGTAKIGVATSSDNGTTWNEVWSGSYTATEQHSILETISGPDMGKENVLFCIYFEGNSYAIQSIYFDNFRVYTIENLNIGMTSIDVPSHISNGKRGIDFTVENYGESTIKSFEARYYINGNEEDSETFYTEIPYNEKKQFTFETEYDFTFGKEYEIEVEIFRVNDSEDDSSDNNMTKDILVAMGNTQRIPMIEHFSSSTCAPCVNVNFAMSMLTDNNPGKYTYTKYAMNWPGAGDPYYTDETGTRRFYYNISGAPELYLDGSLYGMTYIDNNDFNDKYKVPALANIRGAFNVEGNTINITADFMSYFDMKNVKAYVAVNEKTTTGNASTNGETEFHHIMLKMLDSDQGNTLNINAGEYQRLEFSYDMSKTFMEEIDDLEVALWLQDDETKEIFNSHFAYEYTEHCYPARNLKTVASNESIAIKWNAPEKGTPAGYNVYINNELATENISDLEYIIDNSKLGKTVEVVALYENGMTSVGVAKIITADDDENISNIKAGTTNIYPNPANDRLYIDTDFDTDFEIMIYNIAGQLSSISHQRSANGCVINIEGLKPGIYFIEIKSDKGNIVKQFIKQ